METPVEATRITEIALQLQVWQYRQLATERYMGGLKAAAEDLGIADAEMFEFYKVIVERMRRRV